MKVLILTPNYPRKEALMNGVFIHQQVKALQELGVECHVLLLHDWYPKFGFHKYHPNWQTGRDQHKSYLPEHEGIRIHHIPVVIRMPDRLFKNNYYQQAGKAVARYISNNRQLKNADWLYAHFLTDYAYIGAIAKGMHHIKLAAIARGDDVHAWPEAQPSLVNHLQYVFAKADVLLANSARLASDAQKWMSADNRKKLDVVYNGINTHAFFPVASSDEKTMLQQKHGLDTTQKYMICVATPVELKGWLELLKAIEKLGDRLEGWKLLMVANNRNHSDALDLVAISTQLGIEEKVVFMGQVEPSQLAEVYRACDVFVLPSYNEGMANALLEAMSSGLACIATDVGGHAEVIEDKINGVLIQPKDVNAIESALNMICSDSELRNDIAVKARERMIAFGSYTDNAKKLYNLLKADIA